jgi:ADP-ribose pyrophosphatase YjhB (NUDIX family)
MIDKRFVIRVYALISNDRGEVLLSDEYVLDTLMTKFPGGGLEFGEGTIDCLKREAMEEFGQSIEVVSHFYTTDFYQKAMFYDDTQLISVYYIARFNEKIRFRISEKPYDFPEKINGSQSFRWKAISELTSDDLTFPIDKQVVIMFKGKFL